MSGIGYSDGQGIFERRHRWTVGRVLTVIGIYAVALVIMLALVAAFSALGSDKLDCRPVDYVHGAWLNPAGDTVAVAPTEDSTMHYVGPCA